jgi:hypothetical protein
MAAALLLAGLITICLPLPTADISLEVSKSEELA